MAVPAKDLLPEVLAMDWRLIVTVIFGSLLSSAHSVDKINRVLFFVMLAAFAVVLN